MGGYGPAIAQAGIQAGQNDLANTRALQAQERQAKLGILTQAWNQTTDPSQRQQIQTGIDSLYPTPAHAPALLQDLIHLHGKERAAQATSQPAQGASSAQSPIAGPPASSTPQLNELGANMNASPQPQTGPVNELGDHVGGTNTPSQTPQPTAPDLSSVRQVAAAPSAADAWKAIAQIPSTTETAVNRAQASAKAAEALQTLRNQGAITEAQIRVHGNIAVQKLDKEAQAMGYGSFAEAPPEATDTILQHVALASRAPSQAALATYLRTKYGNSPTADQIAEGTREHQQMMSGLKVGEHQQVVFDDSGVPHVITLTSRSETKYPTSANIPSGPSGTATPTTATPAIPVSASTPSGPPNPGARAPGTRPSGGAVKKTAASSGNNDVSNPLGFTKGSPLVKSDSTQYTKLAEEANEKNEALQSARAAASSPSPSSDQQLIYSWVRSNVQGAGRMTQAEFQQASRTGSLPQKAQNYFSLASTGKLTPEIRTMLLNDVQRSAQVSQQGAEAARNQLQTDAGGKKPASSKTPSGPISAPKTADDYLKSIGVQ